MHIPLFSQQDTQRLNRLIGEALTEPILQKRLLTHDPRLIVEFTLPQTVWVVIVTIQAQSLEDFCRQLIYLEQNT